MMTCPQLRACALVLFGPIGWTLAGCAGSEPSKYYLLSTLPSAEAPVRAADSDQLAVGLGPVSMPAYLDRPQLVTRTSANRLKVSEFERWAEPMQDMFARTLAEDLSALIGSDLVYVLPRRDGPDLDYEVAVEVFRFDRGTDGDVTLQARWTIAPDDRSASLLTRRATFHEPTPSGGDPESVIAASSRAVEALAREIASDLQSVAGHTTTASTTSTESSGSGAKSVSTGNTGSTASYDIAKIQTALAARGYDPGPADGVAGPKTRDAIRQFQADQGMQVTGEPSRELQKKLSRGL